MAAMQKIPTIGTRTVERDGVTMSESYYPETGTRLLEYHEAGCLVMLGEPGIWGERSLNVRLDMPDYIGGPKPTDEDFRRLVDVYDMACERHGFAAQPKDKSMRFLARTRGWGVLWAADHA